ncbi:endolytic transglycosylase MltG [Microbacterium sp. cx-55]|uniref:endolytic transglycosylase MltG n=1 Tax=Microbacterium sp. cx-55 TaxID=2875948 RepID=UPI001CC1B08C|nr:endolytic transglycosylase MltG [Microbacterium sp. cx-55]MBZ4486378.1 endolytic transglycosylase MltG [Microbacterium sp. cx-55]UGB36647.1 endolytic transglycosylase MltG [Microbacterium sp. cx-55]
MSDSQPPSRRAAREAAAAAEAASGSARPVTPPEGWSVVSAPAASSARETPAPRAGSLDALFTGEVTTDVLGSPPPPPDKRRRRIGGWIALIVVVALVGGIAGGGFWVWNTYEDRIRAFMGWEEPAEFDAGTEGEATTITIASGDAGPQVSQKLYDAGVTRTPDSLYDYMIENNVGFTFQPGVFTLRTHMTSAAVITALEDPANRMENSTQLREGLTVEQSLTTISEQMTVPIEDLQAAVADPAAYGVPADSLEGWLFPATYTFDPGTTAPQIIQRMVDRTVQSLDAAGVPVDDRQRILTIASIIQREARSTEDFYKVSRVIQNRLDPGNQETFGLLQMDSTAQYGFNELHDGTASSSAEALADDNPWNTYVHPGLPVGPISNPGDTAIDAAMSPAEGNWLYFVTVNLDTGETVFTATAAEHNQAVAQWRAWCTENPDSGC